MENLSIKEKLKTMSFKKKINYIWYYYKFHITVIIILVLLITSFSIKTFNHKETVLNVTLMGKYINSNKEAQIKNQAVKFFIKNNYKKQDISFEFLQTSDYPQDEINLISNEKLTALIEDKDVDVLLLDKKFFTTYVNERLLMNLSNIPDFSKLNLPISLQVKAKAQNLDTTYQVYGIDAENLKFLDFMELDSKNKVLCIISNTKHVSKITEFIKWIIYWKK